jgi:hypothetical protein
MDIVEAARYDSGVGAKHDVGMGRDWPDTRLVRIELCVELPRDVLSLIIDDEAHQPVQIKNPCHFYE